MTYESFSVDIQDRIAHIVLTRPEKRNSMIPAFWRELPEIVADIDGNAKARAIVISSTGPHFSSGMDLAAFGGDTGSAADGPDARAARIRHGASFLRQHVPFATEFQLPGRVPHPGARSGARWLYRRRRGHGVSVRYALRDRGRLLHHL